MILLSEHAFFSTLMPYSMSAIGALLLVTFTDFNRRINDVNSRVYHLEQLISSIKSIDERLNHIEDILDKVINISVK